MQKSGMYTTDCSSTQTWARSEFGRAKLGDQRRTSRLVRLATAAAAHPAGRISQVLQNSAEREGAYRLLEGAGRNPREICRSAASACFQRAVGERFLFVPVDGSSLSLRDPFQLRDGLGPTGNKTNSGRGLQVISAIGIGADGTPMGLLAQVWWSRSTQKAGNHKTRRFEEKETRHIIDTAMEACWSRNQAASTVPLWFQFDRGGDFKELLNWASTEAHLVTVRAAYNRRTVSDDAEAHYLWDEVLATAPLGTYKLPVSGTNTRTERMAHMVVRSKKVQLALHRPDGVAQLTAVLALEEGTTPTGEEPIQWLLLTNYEVNSFEDARLVLFGYSQRWRIEEFHKAWKSVCRVEDTQLRDSLEIEAWATILAAIAMRILRLTYFARLRSGEPATVELSAIEVEAVLRLRRPKGIDYKAVPAISDLVTWIAELGGYTGKSSGGPPGALVLARGLSRIREAAQVLATIE